jgi:hypothetical protein
LHWQTPLANRNLKQRKHQSAHIYAASNRAGQQICDRANRYCTCIAAQLSEPVSPLQLDEVVAAFGNMAPAAQPLCGAAPLPPTPALTCGHSGMLLQRSRSMPTASGSPAVESLVTRAVSRAESISLIST